MEYDLGMRTENLTTGRHDIFRPVILTLAVFCLFLALQPVTRSQTDFYNNLWAPVHLLVRGGSPYDTTPLRPELPALWMPASVGFYSFLGFFDFETAQEIWFLMNSAGLAVLLYLSMPRSRSILFLLAGVLFVYFFPPTINHFALRQISILSALSLLLAARFSERTWLSAIFLALGMAKPQIGFLVLFGLCIHQFRLGGFPRLFRYGLQTMLAVLILSLPLFLAEPNWMPDWIASLRANNVEWTHPSILFPLRRWLGNWNYLPWGGLVAGSFWLAAWLWIKFPPHLAAIWSLGLTVVVTPYVWSWDFVLLLPAFVYVLSSVDWRGIVIMVVGYCIVWGGMAFIQLSASFHNSRFWWVPTGLMGLSAFAAWLRPAALENAPLDLRSAP